MAKNTKSKPKSTENLNQQSTLRTPRVCAYHCTQLSYTVQHRTILIIFPILWTVIAQLLFTRQEEDICARRELLEISDTDF